MSMTNVGDSPHLRLCDACCDTSGTAKEMMKTGGCTCDICGWACKCCGDDGRQFVNRVLVRTIPAEGWAYLQWRNQRSLAPLDWEKLFLHGRREESGK
ncbi:hypothetical protein LF599_17150 [Pseudodesulfovibrio thermohalotolerans]|uniref:hypothetical protein n=1 Tax=Pseudodesulfovibrio thermohalotolerans TaxID=2880651 RepID=UPI0024412DE2|nr:hypothetical protein [Pseudodesulfovibrio thermohalotolerans]WFS62365.1 hypothetical protein LF599_17150 [Pseudodesulfovibrio thermohalotolerans]